MIKIVIELETNEDRLNINTRLIGKYDTDETERQIGKKFFDKLKEVLKDIDYNSLVKECFKESKKECKKSLDELIDLMFNNKEISSKILNEKELDKLVDEILNTDEELKKCGKETIRKILDEIMEED